MSAKELNLVNFRNYSHLEIEFTDNINIFVGENAQGKTNIIEALFINAVGKSHRGVTDEEMINLAETTGKIKLAFTKYGVVNENEFVFFRNSRKKILKNKKATNMANIIGNFNAVLFSPEDLLLMKGSPTLRRKFLNREISQANPTYYHDLCKFNRILTQRNSLLKNIRDRQSSAEYLDEWNEQFAEYATKILGKRLTATEQMANIAVTMQDKISENREQLSITYEMHGKQEDIPQQNIKDWYLQELKKREKKDIIRGVTSIGPQLDDLSVEINGVGIKSYGSQGQQRTAVLSLKLAELQFLRKETSEYPVLLLDDVMSELDERRRQSLAAFLLQEQIQTVITATDINYFSSWKDCAMWQVNNGAVKKLS